MNSDNFLSYANRIGGVLNINHMSIDVYRKMNRQIFTFLTFVNSLNDTFEEYRGVNIEAGYILNEEIRARSTIESKTDIICVGAPLYFWIRAMMYCLANGGWLDFIKFEIYPDPALNIHFPESLCFSEEMKGIHSVPAPENGESKGVADLMIDTAMQYVLHHELAHIWNGHNEFRRARGVSPTFDRSDAERPADIELHALEMDADGRATTATRLWAYEKGSLEDMIKDCLPAFDMVTALHAAATYLTTRLDIHLAKISVDELSLPALDHPPLLYRLVYNLQNLRMRLLLELGFERTETLAWIKMSVSSAEKAFCAITGSKAIDVFSEDSLAFANRIQTELIPTWNTIRNKLELFKRGHKLPYGFADPIVGPLTIDNVPPLLREEIEKFQKLREQPYN